MPAAGFQILHRLGPPQPDATAAQQHARPLADDGSTSDKAARVVHPCPVPRNPELNAQLTRVLNLAFDVLAGRRPDTVLRQIPISSIVRAGLTTRLRRGGIKGSALHSLHTDPRRCGTEAHFVGTWGTPKGVRALAGRADREPGGTWTVTALRLI
ncbi:hypothetical protein KRX51_02655 [Corynebacterium sp. TAE3-ERU12]|uniref:hypothetical protein n=1 Tax=Corynebacterium sp. TAE3-ERU12 TaxID=2849491 RepID=UPI001C46DB71|nr:hypothetical protein [Corynebacterium sp. TAE3-ERU12]MBV7294822.1 hypothetical protein [Corynebacterium sp. TAE3-ERU12]